nr:OsmC family protein [uncultured Dyadobacter sp.]
MSRTHKYAATTRWTGNRGTGTAAYHAYGREYVIEIENKAVIHGSSDPAFRGDRTKHNPEELLLSSLSSCHMLWYLHLCSEASVRVVGYEDKASGIMLETEDGGGRFSEVTLCPVVSVSDQSMVDEAMRLHAEANKLCFIANSVNFPVLHRPIVQVAGSLPLAD